LPSRDFSLDGDHDAGQSRTDWRPQARGNANQRENTTDEGLVGQATEAVRNVAESASDFARDTYDTGARYAREGWDSLPDVDRYSRAVSRPVEENPLVAILAAGAVGYLLAYMIHGSGFQGSSWQGYRKSVPDYTRTRGHRRRRDG
jgi:hypothetical protein